MYLSGGAGVGARRRAARRRRRRASISSPPRRPRRSSICSRCGSIRKSSARGAMRSTWFSPSATRASLSPSPTASSRTKPTALTPRAPTLTSPRAVFLQALFSGSLRQAVLSRAIQTQGNMRSLEGMATVFDTPDPNFPIVTPSRIRNKAAGMPLLSQVPPRKPRPPAKAARAATQAPVAMAIVDTRVEVKLARRAGVGAAGRRAVDRGRARACRLGLAPGEGLHLRARRPDAAALRYRRDAGARCGADGAAQA